MNKYYRIISRELEASPSLVLTSFKKSTQSEASKSIKKWLIDNPSWKIKKDAEDSDWNCSLQSVELV